jgi:hypothetical protein
LPGSIEEFHERPQVGQPVSRSRFELDTSIIRAYFYASQFGEMHIKSVDKRQIRRYRQRWKNNNKMN